MRSFYSATAALIAIALVAPFTNATSLIPAPAEPAPDITLAIEEIQLDKIGFSCGLLGALNCGTATLTVTATGCTTGNLYYYCLLKAKADVTATAWINPGSFSAALNGFCSKTEGASWTINGASRTFECTYPLYRSIFGCDTYNAQLDVYYSGSLAPAAQRRTNSVQVCSPVKAVLYEHINYGGGAYFVTGNIPDFWGLYFSNGVWMNDQTSSILLRSDCVAYLNSDRDYGGDWTYFPYSTSYVGNWINDRASSIDLYYC